MFCLRNFLFRLFQYYGILVGHTFCYIDIKKRQVNFYFWAKIYGYIINLMKCVSCINDFVLCYELFKYNIINPMTSLSHMLQFINSFFIIIFHICFNIKEEQFVKKLNKTFKNLPNISADKKFEYVIILKMLLILIWSIYQLWFFITNLTVNYWVDVIRAFFRILNSWLSHYIICHHCFVLCYFNKIFLKLNQQLENDQVQKDFANTYIQISKILKQFNAIIGPIVFIMLSFLLMKHSFHICFLIQYWINDEINLFAALIYDFLFEIIQYIDILLYFLICEWIQRTTRDTGKIIREYSEKETNLEVCLHFMYHKKCQKKYDIN